MKIKDNNINLTRSGYYGKEILQGNPSLGMNSYLKHRFPKSKIKRLKVEKRVLNLELRKTNNLILSLINKDRYMANFDGRCLRCGDVLFTIPRIGVCKNCELDMNRSENNFYWMSKE